MNRHVFCFCIGAILCANTHLRAQQVYAGAPKKDYRIEVEKDKEGRMHKIYFKSPEGKVLKTLPAKGWPYKTTQIPKNNKYVLHTPEEYMGSASEEKVAEQGYLNYTMSLYDAKGDLKWGKKFKTYPRYEGIEGVEEPWDNGISDDGERVYVNYCDEKSSYTLTVFDVAGKEIASVKHNLLLQGIEISPDGKLVGGETIKDGSKHLFFFDAETGKTKLVKAEIPNISLRAYVLAKGSIQIWISNSTDYKMNRVVDTKFSSIPADILELLQNGEKKK